VEKAHGLLVMLANGLIITMKCPTGPYLPEEGE
jgi:hypothetical protein